MATVFKTDDATVNSPGATTIDFGSLFIYENGGDDIIYFVFGLRSLNSVSDGVVTADGVPMNLQIQQNMSGSAVTWVGLFSLERNKLPDPFVDEVTFIATVTSTSNPVRAICSVYVSPDAMELARAVNSATIADPATEDNTNMTLQTGEGGILIAAVYAGDGFSTGWDWTGADEDIDVEIGGPNHWSSAHADNLESSGAHQLIVQAAADKSWESSFVAAFFPDRKGVEMFSTFDPHQERIGMKAVPVTASVQTSASAREAGLGPFRFLFVQTSTSFSITQLDGTTCSFNDFPAGNYLWVQGAFVHEIANATALIAIK